MFTFAFKSDTRVLIGRKSHLYRNIILYDDLNFPLKIKEPKFYEHIMFKYETHTNDILEFVFINFPE